MTQHFLKRSKINQRADENFELFSKFSDLKPNIIYYDI